MVQETLTLWGRASGRADGFGGDRVIRDTRSSANFELDIGDEEFSLSTRRKEGPLAPNDRGICGREMVPCGRPRDSAYFSSMIEFWSGGEVGFVRRGMEASPSRELTLVFVFFFNTGTGGETERLYRQDLHAWLPSFQPGIVFGGLGGAR